MRHSFLPALAVASALAIGGCLHAPMPWSPDGKWLAYTVEVRPIGQILRPGWLFETASVEPRPDRGRPRNRPPTSYRLWATRADSGASVLLEDSPGPLTAPGWSPDGRALAFGRVVPEAEWLGPIRGGDPGRADPPAGGLEPGLAGHQRRGRPTCRARRSPGAPTGATWRSPSSAPTAWRSSGPTTAGRSTRSTTPSSPPGPRMGPGWPSTSGGRPTPSTASTRPSGQPRPLAEVGQAGQAPAWTRDGLTLMVVARLPVPRDAEPPGERAELLRVRVDNGMVETIRSLDRRPRPGPRPFGRRGLDRLRPRGREPLLLDRRRGPAAPDQLVPPPRRLGLQEVLADGLHGPDGVALALARSAGPWPRGSARPTA